MFLCNIPFHWFYKESRCGEVRERDELAAAFGDSAGLCGLAIAALGAEVPGKAQNTTTILESIRF